MPRVACRPSHTCRVVEVAHAHNGNTNTPHPLTVVLMGGGAAIALGGTSILIVVSVTMDTISQIQSHLLAHQYEGLIKKSRLGGKRRR